MNISINKTEMDRASRWFMIYSHTILAVVDYYEKNAW